MDKRECYLVQIEWATDSDRLSRWLSCARHSSRGQVVCRRRTDTTLCDQDALTGTADAYKKDRSVAELGTWRWTLFCEQDRNRYSNDGTSGRSAGRGHHQTLVEENAWAIDQAPQILAQSPRYGAAWWICGSSIVCLPSTRCFVLETGAELLSRSWPSRMRITCAELR